MTFKYTDNQQLLNELKKTAIDQGVSLTAISVRLGISRQNLNNKMTNKHIPVDALASWLDAMDCDLEINFKPRKKK